jgi:ribosomal peptide maturation radical SAM protein 1
LTASARVLLVTMPFGAIDRPALGLSLLQAVARREGFECDVRYLTLPFAEFLGAAEYLWLTDAVPYESFAGDWVFSEALYGSRPRVDAGYEDHILRRRHRMADDDVRRLRRARAYVEPFLRHCLDAVPWADYDVVGFTSTFQQNVASLALARRVKAAHPQVTIVFGGANWEGEMGVALHRRFRFVDVGCSGEAEESFPVLLRALAAGTSLADVPGIVHRDGDASRATPAHPVEDLDALPIPCYDDYFDALAASSCSVDLTPRLLLETARGCWWGERSHCTFCGLNGAGMAFRSKSPARAGAEIDTLVATYGVTTISVVDNILDMRYFRTLLPALAAGRPLELFWEVKANLSRKQVQTLAAAGVHSVQPGIESMSDQVLDLLAKGTTMRRNLQLLKWGREYGVRIEWNLLFGAPGEDPSEYARQAALFEHLDFLDPPGACGPVRLDRFSPYHVDPEGHGVVNVRAMAPYRYLYDVPTEELDRIAYYFDFDYADGRRPVEYAMEAVEAVERWRQRHQAGGGLWMATRPDGSVTILDQRSGRQRRSSTLVGWKAEVFLACDRARSRAEIDALPSVAGAGADEVTRFLERCVAVGVMVYDGEEWLALPVHTPARHDAEPAAVRRSIPLAVASA